MSGSGRFSVEAAFKAVDNYSSVIGGITKNTDKMLGKLNSGLGKVNAFNSKVLDGLKTAAVAGAAVGGVVGAGLLDIIKTGADFEQSITNVGAVMGKSRGQIGDLEKAAMSLGVTTQFSATQVAEAMEGMARKGFDAGEILQGIPGVLDAIAASGEGMAEVSSVVGSAIRGFGLEASQASHVADVLAFSAEKSGAKITDMGLALANAAPTAKALGVSLEQTAAGVGLMQKMGIDASTAGTAFATMLAKITKPSKDAQQQMTAMGISFQDAKGNMLPFEDVLGQFVKAGDKAGGNMKRMAFLAELVGLRGDKAAFSLSDMAKTGEFQKLVEQLQKVDGYAHSVAEKRMDTVEGSWKLLGSTIEVVKVKLFNLESGPLKGVVDKTNAWVSANQGLIVQKVEDTIGKIAKNLPDIEKWGTRIAEGIGGYVLFAVAVKGVSLAVEGAQLVMGAATLATKGFSLAVRGASAATAWLTAASEGSTTVAIVSTAATWARTTATTAYNTVVGLGASLLGLNTAATEAATLAAGANAAATTTETVAQVAESAAAVTGTAAMAGLATATEGAAAATVAAEASMTPLLVTLGAAAAAVGALYAAWDQLGKLKKETGGPGFFSTADDIISQGALLDPSKYSSTFANQQAEADAASSGREPMLVSRNAGIERHLSEMSSTYRETVDVNINDPGRHATVDRRKGGASNVKLKTAPTGGF
ncbi:MAG TPA: phage tail tape measure protein [Polyangiaceae bacterium]|jgi:TP901 family phage tail tape measure protein|nr:phage tail tape measure protein [Polyangiaceae bacterium]